MIDPQAIFEWRINFGNVVAVVTVLLALLGMHRSNKKDRAEVADQLRKRDEKWLFILSEHMPHSHTETDPKEPLTRDGIRYPHIKFNGGDR